MMEPEAVLELLSTVNISGLQNVPQAKGRSDVRKISGPKLSDIPNRGLPAPSTEITLLTGQDWGILNGIANIACASCQRHQYSCCVCICDIPDI
jgi:hypothetical protein